MLGGVMKPIIRLAKSTDIDELLKLETEANSEIKWWQKQTREEFLESISNSEYNVMVAEQQEKIIGYVQGEVVIRNYGRFENMFLENIYVSKKYRKQGVGKELVKNFTEYWCKKRKYVALITTKENMRIFEKLGFKWTMSYMEIRLLD